jgi:hypothetical protein
VDLERAVTAIAIAVVNRDGSQQPDSFVDSERLWGEPRTGHELATGQKQTSGMIGHEIIIVPAPRARSSPELPM